MEYKKENKICQNCKSDFTIEPDDFSFYEKMQVPAPLICPDCRFKMRAMWRNETTLYSGRTCDMCNKNIVTMYNPKSPYTIYCYNCFYSEKWDPRSYAQDFDFNRSYVEQFKEFLIKVPKVALYLTLGYGENLNSEYVNMASGCKNCYLVFNTGPAEDLLYSRGIRKGVDSSDLYFGFATNRCYESINIQESYGTTYSQNVFNCVDSHFILNGRNLVNCFGCVNLNNKSNCYFNEQLTPEEYVEKTSNILGSYEKIMEEKEKFNKFVEKFPHRENNNFQTVDSSGDYLSECKSVKDSYEVFQSEDCKYIFSSKLIKDSMDVIGYGTNCERLLECVATGFSSNTIGTYGAENSQDILHGFYIKNCHDCVACDALQNGKYSVFNKEYSKEEYLKIKEFIVKELKEKDLYGGMIPQELSLFSYNETIAQDNMPLSREEALAQGFRWEDDIQKTEGKETMKPEEIPDHIKDVKDSITKEVLCCVDCNRNYKITEQELLFYKKVILPIPRKCFYCRHKDRIERRGSYKFWKRNCDKCKKEIITNYAPNQPEIVYCEKCYQQEVY
ncbi:MAG: hypothetical protein QG583_847 [Patescibacteria group bacterium]|nr:hypothetical protein [Patescibacteria group bacterium]